MNYIIFSSTAPAMPSPAKGTEFVKLLLSQASTDIITLGYLSITRPYGRIREGYFWLISFA